MSLFHAFGQNTLTSEAEVKKQAAKFFDDEDYAHAYPLYSQLLSNYPKDPAYNYRFGLCVLKASDDKEKPIPYLEVASRNPDVEKEVFFWLGKAYHLNYRFDDAIASYNKFKSVASKSAQQKLEVDREIEACNNGKKLLRYITDITVLEKKDLARENYFRSYDLAGIGGKLLVKPDDFTTSLDKKKKDQSIVFLSPNNELVYYASYGDKGETGKDIYMVRRLPNGGWGKPQKLSNVINTPYDEDFPYLHPNGKVLYFCSKGHNSMGGYDIFKSTLDESTGMWGKPVNLDFPINSPDDDILYVTDGDEQNAFFSSGRGSVDGKITVYKVKVERRPIDVAMLKGTVKPYRSDQRLDSRIIVKDLSDGETVGVYNANKEGSYFMDLPNGGKYLFTVETPGLKTQSEMVELPVQYELKMMKQIITYEEDKLIVKTFVDEAADNAYIDALSVIKEKAKLNVNKDEPVPDVQDTSSTPDNSVAGTQGKNNGTNQNTSNNGKNSTSDLSNEQIVKIAYDDAKETSEEAKDLKTQADMAFSIANKKNELALSKAKEAEQILTNVNSITDPQKKQEEIDKANNLNREADKLTKETVAAFNIAKKLDADAQSKQQEADLSMQYAKDLETAVKSNSKDAMAKLEDQQKKLEEMSQKSNGSADVYNSLKSEADNKQRELIKAREKSESLQEDIEGITKEAQDLRSEANNTKNEDLKKSILEQAKELDEEKTSKQKELDANNEKVARLQDEADRMKSDAEMVSTLMNQIKGTDNATDVASNNSTANNTTANNTVKNNTASNSNTNAGNNTAANNNVTNSNASDNSTAANNKNGTNTSDNSTGTTNTVASNTNTAAGNNTVASNNTSGNNTDASANNVKNTSGNNAGDNTTAANTSASNNAGNSTATNTPGYSVKYENQLADASKNGNAYESEATKAKLYQDWAADINKDLDAAKESLKKAKTKEDKNLYKQKVADLEKQAKEKEQLSKDAFAKAEQLKKDQSTASNTTGNNTSTASNSSNSNTANAPDNNNTGNPSVTYNQQYSEKLKQLDQSAETDYQKEVSRSEMYTDWAKAIDKDIEQKKQDAAATTDPEMKALLEKKIQDLEQLSKEKNMLAGESSKKAEQLKGQTAVVTTNNVDPGKINDNTSNKTSNTDTVANSSGTGDIDETDYSAKHDREIEGADKLASGYQKELERSKIYDQWVKDINNEIAEQKTALKKTRDKNQKKAITEKIKTLEADAKEKQQLADASAKNAEKLKGQDVLASNNTNAANDNSSNTNSSTTSSVNDNSSNKTGNDNSSSNNTASNNTTTAINNTNSNTASNNTGNTNTTAANNNAANNTGDPLANNSTISNNTQAANNTGNNTSGNSTSSSNNTTANNTTAGTNAANNNTGSNNTSVNNTAATNNTTASTNTAANTANNNNTAVNNNAAGNNTSAANNTATNDPAANTSNNAGTNNTTTIPGSKYTTLTNAALEKKAEQLVNESESLMEQSEALRTDGSPEEADEKKKEAEDKKLEAARLLSEANKNEFNNNNARLEDLAKLSAKKEEADLSLAELLKDEAKTYYDKAQESRKNAETAPDFYTKQSAMQKAYDNEMIALEKQKKANDIYMKYNPTYTGNVVASNTNNNTNGNDPAGSNNSANRNSNTNSSASNSTSNTTSGNTASNNTASNNTASNNTASNNTASNNTAANNTSSGNNTVSNTNNNTANNTTSNTAANNNSGASNTNTTAANNTASNTTSGNTASNSNTTTNNTAANTSTASNNSSTNTNASNTNNTSEPVASNASGNGPDSTRITPLSPQQVEVVKNSREYKSYMTIKGESEQADKEAQREYKVAAQYTSETDRLQGLANQLKQDAGSVTDPKQKQETQRKVKDYETQASINRTKADSVTELARNSEAASKAKRTEADLFLNSLDEQVYNNLSAVTGDKKSTGTVVNNTTTGNTTASNTNSNSNTANNNTATNSTTANNSNSSNTNNNTSGTANNTTATSNTASNTNNTNVTTLTANDVFVKTNGAAYSPSQPIPIDQKRPEGIIFAVQIGAFKNPIPQDLFKGMKPIVGESTPQGVIRYTAGMFKSFSTANSVKDEIRGLGYPDAFVVAFKDGKRISVSEAVAALGGTVTGNSTANTSSANTNTNTSSTGTNNNNTAASNTNTNAASNTDAAKSEDIVTVKGLLYTVQVGVYARPVSAVQLYNITPLYTEQAPNGYLRYTSGIYNDINKAVQAKNIIVEIGVKDAFVTAYYNGKRITIAEAKQLEAEKGASVFATAANMNVMPSRGQGGAITQLNNNVQNTPVNPANNNVNTPVNPVNSNTPVNNTPINNTPVNPANNTNTGTSIAQKVNASVEDAGVVYKVQIGAFKEEVPIEIANKFLSVGHGGIRNYKDENGLTIYTLGVYKSYNEANALKADLVKEGLIDAFVVAYNNGKKITVEEARNLLGQ